MKIKIIILAVIALIICAAVIPASANMVEKENNDEIKAQNIGRGLSVKVTKTNGKPVAGEKVTITTDNGVSFWYTNLDGYWNDTSFYGVGQTVTVSVRGVVQEHTFTLSDPIFPNRYVMEFTVRSGSHSKTTSLPVFLLQEKYPLLQLIFQRIVTQ